MRRVEVTAPTLAQSVQILARRVSEDAAALRARLGGADSLPPAEVAAVLVKITDELCILRDNADRLAGRVVPKHR